MKLIRESEIEAHLVKIVKAKGGIAYKFTSPSRRNVPDRMILLPGGKLFFAECKAPRRKATAGQLREHQRIAELGFSVVIVDSFDVEALFDD